MRNALPFLGVPPTGTQLGSGQKPVEKNQFPLNRAQCTMSSPFSVLTEIGNEPKDSIDVDESFGVVTDSPEKHEQNGFEETSSPKPLDEPAELNLDEETPKTSEVPSYVVDETLASITALTNASTSAHASSSSPVERDPFAASPSPQVASPLLTQVPPSAKARASPAPVQEDQIPVAKAPRVLVIFHGEEQGPGTSR